MPTNQASVTSNSPPNREVMANTRHATPSGAKRIVTACPECARTLALDYPALGFDLGVEVLHISQWLAQAMAAGKVNLTLALAEIVEDELNVKVLEFVEDEGELVRHGHAVQSRPNKAIFDHNQPFLFKAVKDDGLLGQQICAEVPVERGDIDAHRSAKTQEKGFQTELIRPQQFFLLNGE